MRVAITGASGLIGRHLTSALIGRGDEVVPLSRANGQVHGVPTVEWDPVFEDLPGAAMDGVDAIVNLAGASVAEGRWTREHRKLIHDSRVITTTRIADALAAGDGPRVLVSGSATGYYGNRGDELLGESAAPGTGFLSEVAVAWEAYRAAARGGRGFVAGVRDASCATVPRSVLGMRQRRRQASPDFSKVHRERGLTWSTAID